MRTEENLGGKTIVENKRREKAQNFKKRQNKFCLQGKSEVEHVDFLELIQISNIDCRI